MMDRRVMGYGFMLLLLLGGGAVGLSMTVMPATVMVPALGLVPGLWVSLGFALVAYVIVGGAGYLGYRRRVRQESRRQVYAAKQRIENVLTPGTGRYRRAEQALESAAAALNEQDYRTVQDEIRVITDIISEDETVDGLVKASLAREAGPALVGDEVAEQPGDEPDADAEVSEPERSEAVEERDAVEEQPVPDQEAADAEEETEEETEMAEVVEEVPDEAFGDEVDLSVMTVSDVKLLVEEGALEPVEAFEKEKGGEARRTLLSWLEEEMPFEEWRRHVSSEDVEWDWRISERTIDEVKALVEDDVVPAHRALDVERAGRERKTLIDWLEGRV